MARLVLISIPDNADAEAFVNAMQAGHIFYGTPKGEEVEYHDLDVAADVEAVWGDPTKLCECHPKYQLPNPINKGDKGLTCQSVQTVNFKWWVCSQCKMPHPHQVQHPRNLLDPNTGLAPRKYTLGFRSDRSEFTKEENGAASA